MAITVKHLKVSTVPDAGDDTLVEPSDWNADHTITGTVPVENGGTGASTLTGYVKGNGTAAMTAASTIPNTDVTGLGSMSTQNANNVNITGGSISGTTVSGYIPTTEKGAALGVATLDAGGKVPQSQIPLMGDLNYQGTWNASTNTPTLTSSVGTKGYYYVVDVSGNTNLNGITDWVIGDWAIFNGSIWQKVDNTDAVTSVNGQVGTVVLTTTNIAEGTNEYFTTAKARQSISAGTGISYDNSTGVVTNAAPDQTVVLTDGTAIDVTGTYPNFTINNTAPDQIVALTGAGTTTVTGTYPNFTITSNDEFDGDVVGPASATDNAIARFDGTTGKLIQNSIVTVSDTGAISGVINESFTPVTAPAYAEGRVFYDTDAKTLCYYNDNTQMTVNIGQENIVRVRNQTGANLTNGTVVYINGATGNTPTVAKAIATSFATADIIGVLTTDIANNGFGYATTTGLVNGLDLSAFVEGDAVFLSATTAGAFTTTEATAPNYSIQVGVVLRANPSIGTLLVAIQIISTENIHIVGTIAVNQGGTGQTSYTNGQLLIGNTTGNTLTKATLTAGTAIGITNGAGSISIANTGVTSAVAGTGISVSGATGAVTVTNTAPDQVVSITGAGTTSVTGTYPNFTVTSNDQFVGTVTSVAALTIGTTGTDLSSTVANSTTTPVITLQVPTASATNRGALSAADWTTFNAKAPAVTYTTNYVPFGQGTTTPALSASFTYTTGTGALRSPAIEASNGLVVNNLSINTSYSIPSGYGASSVGPVVVASGVTITVPSGSRWVVL